MRGMWESVRSHVPINRKATPNATKKGLGVVFKFSAFSEIFIRNQIHV